MNNGRQRPPIEDETRLNNARDQHRDGQANLAVPIYQDILARQPDHPEALHLLGLARLQSGDAIEAEKLLARAVELAPDSPKVANNHGVALFELGQPEQAAREFTAATKLDGGFAEAHFNLGRAFHVLRRYEDAVRQYTKAIEVQPDHFAAHNNLGVILFGFGHLDKAIEVARTAMRLRPDAVEPLANLASALEAKNRVQEASEIAQRLVKMAPDMPAVRVMIARVARREGRLDDARELLEAVLAGGPTFDVEFPAWVELSQVLDRQKQYSQAFSACVSSKNIQKSLSGVTRFDSAAVPKRVTSYLDWLETAQFSSPSGITPDKVTGSVFFTGFPRSGTTLMEQIIASHPDLVTTNERTPFLRMKSRAEEAIGRPLNLPLSLEGLTNEEIKSLRMLFLDEAQKITGDNLSRRRLIDKLPLNIIELGAVNFLLPDTKAVIALRDPRDVALSCFMQHFEMNESMVQFVDLETTGQFYAQVMGLWLRYRDKLTIPWIEYRYEDLVDDFEGTVRPVIEFIGVPWDESVKRHTEHALGREIRSPSYAAVTEKINRNAVGRWRNYASELAPILPMLEPFVKEFGYDPD